MINEILLFSLSVFTGFFAINNPIAFTPVFISSVDGMSHDDKKIVARRATMLSFLIVISFIILGKYIFNLFDITIPAFKITGGILLFYIGFEMLMSHKSEISHTGKAKPSTMDVAVSPLAIPILAGPGTIVTATNFVTDADYIHIAVVIVMFAIMSYLTYLTFSLSDRIVQKLGHNLIAVVGKLMGLILAIMGVGMIIYGIKLSFKLM